MSNDDAFGAKVCGACLDAVVDLGGGSAGSTSAFSLPADVIRKQRDGTVALYNILREHRVALLADEVGMGKTYQGLAVIILLLAQNPAARVLIIAPNESVQNGWRRSYSDFIRTKALRGWLKEPIFGEQTHPLYNCANIPDFAAHYLNNPRGIFLTRISSFSSLRKSLNLDSEPNITPKKIFNCWKQRKIFLDEKSVLNDPENTQLKDTTEINVECARQLASILEPFDLVLIDESHNIRHRGNNIKTNVLATLLGFRKPELDNPNNKTLSEPAIQKMPRLLLLTATPAYSSEQDIFNQFAYLDRDALDGSNGKQRHRWVQKRTVRRLRQLSGKTKYEYRAERALPTLSDEPPTTPDALAQELMLALVQKRLAEHFSQRDNLNASIKIGYLETFESFENPDAALEYLKSKNYKATHDDVDDKNPEVSEADDAKILRQLAADYQTAFDDDINPGLPPHPKLTFIEDSFKEILRKPVPEKILVFARRRASVSEVSRRLCNAYDDVTLAQLRTAYTEELAGVELTNVKDFQRFVHQSLAQNDERVEALVELTNNQKDDEFLAFSGLLLPFKSSPKDPGTGNTVSAGGFGFRQRFTSTNLLAHFFDENHVRLLHDLLRNDATEPDVFPGSFENFVERYVSNATLSLLENEFRPDSKVNKRALLDYCVLDAITTNCCPTIPEKMKYLAKVLRDLRMLAHKGDKQFTEALTKFKTTRPSNTEDNPKANALLHERHFWDWARHSARETNTENHPLLATQRASLAAIILPALPCQSEELESTASAQLKRRATWMEMLSKQLRMSDGIIDLFFAFIKAKKENGEIDRDAMAHSLAQRVLEISDVRFSRLRHRLIESDKIFEPLLKHLEVNESQWLNNGWNDFDNQEPALGVMGNTGGHKRAIAQFNAPFFPDIIVSTSVLREGVDLQLSCRRVWHYGLPASPGSLEQQTGRVDRYFARVHRALEQRKTQLDAPAWAEYQPGKQASLCEETSEETREETLEVGFPYLPRSVDEMQLKRLLERKGKLQPIMDRGLSLASTSEDFNLDHADDRTVDDIIASFQNASAENHDPFPAAEEFLSHHATACSLQPTTSASKNSAENAEAALQQLLRDLSESIEGSSISITWQATQLTALRAADPLMLLNTFIQRDKTSDARHQPTFVHLRFVQSVGLYMLEFKTPLSDDSKKEQELRTKLMLDYPQAACSLVTTAHSPAAGTWSINLACALPLSFEDGFSLNHTEKSHVLKRLQTLMRVADELEHAILDGADLKVDEVKKTISARLATENA